MHHLGFLKELKERQEQMQNLRLENLKDTVAPIVSFREIPKKGMLQRFKTSREDQQQDHMKI